MRTLPRGERTTLLASDGYSLTATRFGAGSPLRGHIVVAGATGVPQTFYARFAGYVASRGFTTLTFDYRGIGQSKPASLDDPAVPELRELCMRVRAPIAAANALDDAWAPPRSRDAFLLNAYRNTHVDRIDIDPHDLGPIGHMGYFRRNASPLWDRVLDWFAERHMEGSWDARPVRGVPRHPT
ncbi:alpha/beta hydrolase [Cystobacter fuscus]|uniref:Alpha/beta hydrolase n=1 Tax=Cystobacter fuscus TaxID=43 RepID=A0A250ITY7_9BACT|nr:hypothetical protein [Cystobacter fuscus]ATB34712.1 alpha/beta hydrolase [Cystobacter fuscus]